MIETSLSTNADAQLILRLYELRTDPEMRQAREWVVGKFWPSTPAEFFAVQDEFGSQENAWLRQVTSYWEMAASFVLHGALNGELFMDCNGENLFLLAKFHPLLEAIRARSSSFLVKTEELVQKYPDARRRFETMLKTADARSARIRELATQ
jgi:hypothetical protein